jgi:hypothetical protein
MANPVAPADRRPLLWIIDPRRSLVTGAVWLIIALAVTFSIAAAIWVGAIARQNLLEQHVRRLSLETDQLSSDVGQAIDARLAAVRAAARILRENRLGGGQRDLKEVFDELSTAYPQLDWIAIADSHGIVVDALGALQNGRSVETSPWFRAGLRGPWLGTIDSATNASASTASELGDLAAPVRDDTGRVVGVVAAHLSWRRSANHPQRLTDETDQEIATQALVLDRNRVVLVGPPEFLDKPWSGVPANSPGASAERPMRSTRRPARHNSSSLPPGGRCSLRAPRSAPATKYPRPVGKCSFVSPMSGSTSVPMRLRFAFSGSP